MVHGGTWSVYGWVTQFGEGKLMVTPTDRLTDRVNSAICLFEGWKIKGRDLQFRNYKTCVWRKNLIQCRLCKRLAWSIVSLCYRFLWVFHPCRQFQICVNCSPSSTMFHAVVTSWVCFHSPVLQSNSRVQQRFDLVVAEDYREVSSLFRGEIEEYIAYGW